jgi:leukotriene-A4 hydrolase
MVALMSATRKPSIDLDNNKIKYEFEQRVVIPSYLLALVVADLVSKKIGPISHVWTEREMIEKAAYEFADINEMLEGAIELMGDYVWGIYDLLVLPPTFPFGGMENPCLTFVTPTLLAGDRSLCSVVQHEIAHSWTGNLVTNCNWEHFWLNEGFTKFVEQKLVGKFCKSEQQRHFRCIDGQRSLKNEVCSI